jgi:hypothetical protein
LNAAGCGRIFEEKVSADRWNRPELSRLLDHLRKDDVLVVWKLDRLSRSLKDVLTLMDAPCCASEPAVAGWPPVKKVVSAVAVPSSRQRNKKKLPT